MRVLTVTAAPESDDDIIPIWVTRHQLDRGERFEPHHHPEHQLAWSPSGIITVEVENRRWTLAPSLAMWIPGGMSHDVLASGQAELHGIYLDPGDCPIDWPNPTVVAMPPLLRSLVPYLADPELDERARSNALAVLYDNLRPLELAPISVVVPEDTAARRIAERLLADPADGRSLSAWGQLVGASARTLSRRFVEDTDLTFVQWRTLVRVSAAMTDLRAGSTVAAAAHRVGYRDPSSFIAVFRRLTGATPGSFAAPG